MAINYWASLEPDQVYHIYNHAVGPENLFREARDYHFFLKRWKKKFETQNLSILANFVEFHEA